jgi:putative Mn2+ efflux pump MntP
MIPWVALILLGFIGSDMLIGGIRNKEEAEEEVQDLTFKVLFVQAIATSIDALSVGFSIANYSLLEAGICASIIAVITFAICVAAVYIGKKFGTKLGNKAEIFGGIILILIGIEIFITGIFF